MEVFGGLLLFVSLIGILVFLALTVVALVKKNGKVKRQLMLAGGSFVLVIISFIIIGSSADTVPATTEIAEEEAKPEEEELTAEEEAANKAEEEAKAKAEAEAQAKAEEEARIAAEQAAADKKANAQPIEYAQLIKNPDRHAGTYVKYTGEIVQIQEGDNLTGIRLAVTQDEYGWNTNDILWVEYPGYTEYVDGDVITVYGEIFGSYSYTSQAGWEISIPAVVADSFE